MRVRHLVRPRTESRAVLRRAPSFTAAVRLDNVRLALAAVVAMAIAIRVAVATSDALPLDGDEAVTAIMASRILDGDLPLFFGVQNYQGALEQYLQAPMVALFGAEPLALRAVPIALAVTACILTYFIAVRVCGSRWAGVTAAALMAIGPPYLITKGVLSHGGYGGAMVAGLTAILLALHLRQGTPRPRLLASTCGLTAGVALWENPIAAYLVVPAMLWIAGSMWRGMRRLIPWALAGLGAGLSPIIIHQAMHGLSQPYRSNQQPPSTFAERLDGLVESVVPRFFGLDPQGAVASVAVMVTGACVVALVAAVVVRWHGLQDVILLRTAQRSPVDVVILGLILCPIIYALSPFAWLTAEPRYLFTAYPLVAIAVIAAISSLQWPHLRAALAALAVGVSILGFGAAAAAATTREAPSIATSLGNVTRDDLGSAASALMRMAIDSAYANYWIGGPLQAATGSEVEVATGALSQMPSIEARVRQSTAPAVILPTGHGADATKARLEAAGHVFTEHRIGTVTVLADVSPPWHPDPLDPVFGAG